MIKLAATAVHGTILALICAATTPVAVAAVDDLALQQLADTIRTGNWTAMRQQAAALRARGVDLGTEILYFEGRAAFEEQAFDIAEQKLAAYTGSRKRVAYESRATRYLNETRERLAAIAAAAAAAAALAEAQDRWLARNRAGRIVAVDVDWGFVTIEIPDAERIREPIALVNDDKIHEFGPLKAVGDGRYTATVIGGVRDIPADAVVHACCRPSTADAGVVLDAPSDLPKHHPAADPKPPNP